MVGEERLYAFSLKGAGMNFAREVDEPTARALLHIALGGPAAVQDEQTKPASNRREQKSGSQSVREFLNEHQAKRNPEKIAAVGEYLASTGVSSFSKDDLLSQFRIARESMPRNFRRDLTWTVATGWIAEDPQNPGNFYVTQTGKNAVEGNFSAEIKKKSGFRSVRRRRRSK
jgi:hypothetical protein